MLMNVKYGRVKLSEVSAKFKYVGDVLAGKTVLGGDDGQILAAYASCVGATDPQSQIDYLNERKAILKKLRDESAENYKKYSSLYVKIALMVGILLAVLLA